MSIFMKKKKKRIMAIAIVLIMLMSMMPEIRFANAEVATACTISIVDSEGSISGATVEYSVTHKKIVNNNPTEVTLLEPQTTTSNEGIAMLSGISEEVDGAKIADGFTIHYTISKDGYYSVTGSQSITELKALESVTLTETYAVTVTKNDGTTPIVGAKVVCTLKENSTSKGEMTVTTNSQGIAYLTDLKEYDQIVGNSSSMILSVSVSKDDFISTTSTVSLNKKITGSTTVTLNPYYEIQVKDASNKLLTDVSYSYSFTATDSSDATKTVTIGTGGTRTAKDGRILITGFVANQTDLATASDLKLNITVKKNDYYDKTEAFSINMTNVGNSTVTQTIKMERSVVDLSVTVPENGININKDTATVTVDNQNAIPSTLTKADKHTIKIDSQEGYIITDIKVNNVSQKPGDTTSYTINNLDVSALDEVEIEVTLATAYKVTVTVDANAKEVETKPACEAGKTYAVVKENGEFQVKVTPNDHYRVSKVVKTVGGTATTKTFEDNNKTYQDTISKVSADVSYDIAFAPNNYTVSTNITGHNSDATCMAYFDGDTSKVTYTGVYNSSTKLYIKQSNNRIINEVKYGGNTYTTADLEIDNTDGNLFYLDIKEIYQNVLVEISYKGVEVIAPGSPDPLTDDANYAIKFTKEPIKTVSNEDKLIYVLPSDGVATVASINDAHEGCALNGATQNAGKKLTVNKDIVIKSIKLFKSAKSFAMVTPLDINIVIDDDAPMVEASIMEQKDYYNTDVVVNVNVDDAISGENINLEEYSGIESIKYWISVGKGVDTEKDTPTGVFDYSTLEQLQSRNETVTIEASKYNYDDIVLTVQTEDFAGNTSKKEITGIHIDATAPQVSLTYDNNNNYNGSQYFNASRTATVVVTEREKSFDKAEATKNIVITTKDAKGQEVASAYTVSDWTTKVDAENDNLTTHTATIAFTEDANYTLAMNFKDAAGNPNTAITTGNSVAPYAFTVDTTIPEGSVTAKFAEKKEPKVWKSLVKDLTFGYYSTKNIAISGTTTDATSPILSVQYYKQAKTEGGTALTALTVDALNAVTDWKTFEGISVTKDEEFVVYLKIMDCAGNYTYISTDGLIVDKTKPVDEVFAPKITVDPEQPVNDYYNKDVTISLKIEDPRVNGTCSGIQKISYEVYNEAIDSLEPTQEGVLYEYKSGEETKQNWSGKIKVDSSLNNSDDIVVVVRAEDKAGNYDDYTKEIKIDTTTPTVDIKYSNNSAVSDKYFDKARTATIVVTERNFVTKDMKLVITNSDGVAPKVSKWKKTKGTGNGDDTKWIATVNYVADGDYTFKLTYQDRAGNKATPKYAEGTVAAKEFTIDQTKPEISVSYNNNNVHNGEYYNQARRATVTVTEHNFDPARVETTIRAEGNGASTPSISSWSTSGDVHTATISYANDGKYTFDISATDLAGNATSDFAEQSFYVDQTVPELEITGIEDQSANAEDVAPIVTYSDSNFDANALNITLTGANRGVVKLDGSYDNSATGGKFTFKNFAKVQDVDDIYTLSATVTDKAGNSVSKEITFSVNRFGSTYEFSEETKEVNESYVQEAQDLVIVETNPTKLSGIKVTLFQNNETILLQEDKDYTLNVTGGNGKWYHYTYTIFKEVFANDGVYKIVIHSEDGAKNVSENIMETKDAELRFGVDKTKPTLVVANLESDKAYDVENLTVIMSANDNLMLAEISVLLDGQELGPWSGASLEKVLDQNGELTFDIPGTSNKSHDVKIICKDAAGNETELEITDFYVTTNGWVLFFNNKPLFYGSILGVLAMIGLIVFVIVKKRKKAEA